MAEQEGENKLLRLREQKLAVKNCTSRDCLYVENTKVESKNNSHHEKYVRKYFFPCISFVSTVKISNYGLNFCSKIKQPLSTHH